MPAVYDRVSRTTTPVSRPPAAPLDQPPSALPPSAPTAGSSSSAAPIRRGSPASPHQPALFDGSDVFLFDRTAGKISLVSHAAASPPPPATPSPTLPRSAPTAPASSISAKRPTWRKASRTSTSGQDLFAYDVSTRTQPGGHPAGSRPPLPLRPRGQPGQLPERRRPLPRLRARQPGLPQPGRRLALRRADEDQLLVSHVPSSATTPARGSSLAPVLSADGESSPSTATPVTSSPEPTRTAPPAFSCSTGPRGPSPSWRGPIFRSWSSPSASCPSRGSAPTATGWPSPATPPTSCPASRSRSPTMTPTKDVFLFDRVTARPPW